MVFREAGEQTAAAFWTPLLWWQTLMEAHLDFVDKAWHAATDEAQRRRDNFYVVQS